MEKYEILRIFPEKEERITDSIAGEIPLTIYINNEEIVTLLASPDDIKELAVGFAFTSGLIKSFSDIESIIADDSGWVVYLKLRGKGIDSRLIFKRVFTSGCGRGTLFYSTSDLLARRKKRGVVTIDRRHVFSLMKKFQSASPRFKETGCLHSAALADKLGISTVKEDIGRHNAIDKIIGNALMDGAELKDKIILLSGRVSSEVLHKIQKTDISMVISQSAPTNQAIKHADESGIALIGFARGERMNVYCGMDRVT